MVSMMAKMSSEVTLATRNISKCVRCESAILKAVATVDQLSTAAMASAIALLFSFIVYI